AALEDFNILLSVQDKNKITSNIFEILKFRELINDIGLLDMPLLNRSFTWLNGRCNFTLELLDRALISYGWQHKFLNFTLRISLSANTLSLHLRYPTALNVIYTVWNQALLGLDASSHFAAKIKRPRALDSWSAGLTSAIKKQSNVCFQWIEWLDKSEETRPISNMESLL
ncbi:hypothetical protein ACMD2_16384, partial [Ananas comosus]